MSQNSYFINNLITVSVIFTDKSGNLIDPTSVNLKIERPDSVIITYIYGVDSGLTRDSLGKYHFDINANIAGQWTYFWMGIGVGESSNANIFIILDPFVNIQGTSPSLF